MGMESIGLQDFHTLLHLGYEVLFWSPAKYERKEHIMHTLSAGEITHFFSKQTDAFQRD
jgi:hypothetical protein